MADINYHEVLLDRIQQEMVFTGEQVAKLLGLARSTLSTYHNAKILPDPKERGQRGVRAYRYEDIIQYMEILESLPKGEIHRMIKKYSNPRTRNRKDATISQEK